MHVFLVIAVCFTTSRRRVVSDEPQTRKIVRVFFVRGVCCAAGDLFFGAFFAITCLIVTLTPLEPQSRFGDKLLEIRVVCPHIWDCGSKRVKTRLWVVIWCYFPCRYIALHSKRTSEYPSSTSTHLEYINACYVQKNDLWRPSSDPAGAPGAAAHLAYGSRGAAFTRRTPA